MKSLLTTFFVFILLSVLGAEAVYAEEQVLDDQEILNVENLYKNPPPALIIESSKVSESTRLNGDDKSSIETPEDKAVAQPQVKEKINRLTDLNQLSPFREVSIIQKKYLPKTERFQLFAAGGTTTNSPWFLNLGVKLNIGYFFTESFGLELSGIFLSNSERQVSKEIRETNNLQPEKFVNTKNYVGIDLVWAPIYGKVTYLNDRIIPFDMYFSVGGGSSSTNSQEGSNSTFHLGIGQIFALTKSMAFRWDYSWNMYQATPVADSALVTSTKADKNTYNDLILTAGVSFFFPEVSNR